MKSLPKRHSVKLSDMTSMRIPIGVKGKPLISGFTL